MPIPKGVEYNKTVCPDCPNYWFNPMRGAYECHCYPGGYCPLVPLTIEEEQFLWEEMTSFAEAMNWIKITAVSGMGIDFEEVKPNER